MAIPIDEVRNVVVIILALLAVLVFGWYVVGGQLARRRGADLARSAYNLVRPLGSAGQPTWLRGGGCRFALEGVRQPFARLQVVVRPAPRTLPVPIPVLETEADRRDLLAFAIDLSQPPALAFDLVEPNTAVGLRALRRAAAAGWRSEEWTLNGRTMTLQSPDVPRAQELIRHWPRVPGDGGTATEIVRLAVSPSSPHLGITVVFSDALTSIGPRLAPWLSRIADYLSKSSPEKMV
jgi:hypothetical protein